MKCSFHFLLDMPKQKTSVLPYSRYVFILQGKEKEWFMWLSVEYAKYMKKGRQTPCFTLDKWAIWNRIVGMVNLKYVKVINNSNSLLNITTSRITPKESKWISSVLVHEIWWRLIPFQATISVKYGNTHNEIQWWNRKYQRNANKWRKCFSAKIWRKRSRIKQKRSLVW